MKRFYRETSAIAVPGGFGAALDGRRLSTPAKNPLVVPTLALAQAVAAEWQAQSGAIKPLAMPLNRLAATAIDRWAKLRHQAIDEIVDYAGTDLLSYRAENPPDLAARQDAAWQPLLDWFERRFGLKLQVTRCIVTVPQPRELTGRVHDIVAARDDFALAALHALTMTTGSVVIALAVAEGEIDHQPAYDLSLLDELYQAEQWGVVAEAMERRRALAADLAAAANFLTLCRGPTI